MTEYMGGTPPPRRVIAVTRGADRKFTLRRRNSDGDLVNWDAAVYVNVQTKTSTVKVPAVVIGSDAVVRLESTLLDTVDSRTTWQAIMSVAGTPSLENPIAVGTFERHDGR